MPLVLIVGPSGVGKSTLARLAAELVGAVYVDLDAAADVHGLGPPYHHRAMPLVESYAADADRWYVVDVGAGFQAEPQGMEWMHPHREGMITVMAAPEVVLGRLQASRRDGRTLEGFIAQEFSAPRFAIYDMASHCVDNSGDVDVPARGIAGFISHLMDAASS